MTRQKIRKGLTAKLAAGAIAGAVALPAYAEDDMAKYSVEPHTYGGVIIDLPYTASITCSPRANGKISAQYSDLIGKGNNPMEFSSNDKSPRKHIFNLCDGALRAHGAGKNSFYVINPHPTGDPEKAAAKYISFLDGLTRVGGGAEQDFDREEDDSRSAGVSAPAPTASAAPAPSNPAPSNPAPSNPAPSIPAPSTPSTTNGGSSGGNTGDGFQGFF